MATGRGGERGGEPRRPPRAADAPRGGGGGTGTGGMLNRGGWRHRSPALRGITRGSSRCRYRRDAEPGRGGGVVAPVSGASWGHRGVSGAGTGGMLHRAGLAPVPVSPRLSAVPLRSPPVSRRDDAPGGDVIWVLGTEIWAVNRPSRGLGLCNAASGFVTGLVGLRCGLVGLQGDPWACKWGPGGLQWGSGVWDGAWGFVTGLVGLQRGLLGLQRGLAGFHVVLEDLRRGLK